MAFSYKNPVESAINLLPSKFSDQALASTAEQVVDRVERLNDFFSYSMSKESEESLISHGVELAPIAFKVHSHPVCKTIENHLIMRVIPLTFSKVPSIALVSMREEKCENFLKIRNFSRFGVIKALKPLNSFFDSKDNFRYLDTESLAHSHAEMVANLRKQCEEAGWFPKVVFVHDELHFWSPENLMDLFSEIPEIQTLVGTVVCPPEILLGEKVSKNRRIYTFEIEDGSMHFFPDGVPSEGYCQDLKTTLWWLKTSQLQKGDVNLRISLTSSLFAHHVLVVDRGEMLQRTIFMEKPDCLLEYELHKISRDLSEGIIERATMSSILMYLSCLKNPNKESALAKLKQLEKRALFPDEAFIVSSISSTFIKNGFGVDLDDSLLQKFYASLVDRLPFFAQELINKKKTWNLLFRDFMSEIAIKHFKVNRSVKRLREKSKKPVAPVNLEDRPSRPYLLVRRTFQTSGFLGSVFRIFLFGDGFFVKSIPVDLKKDYLSRRVEPQVPSTHARSICFNDEEPEIIYEETAKDSYSTSGVVLEPAMVVPEEVKVSKEYRKRKNCCVFDSLSPFLEKPGSEIIEEVFNMDISPELFDAIEDDSPLSVELIIEVCICLDVLCFASMKGVLRKFNLSGRRRAAILLENGHATPLPKKKLDEIINELGVEALGNLSQKFSEVPLSSQTHLNINFERAHKLMKSLAAGCSGILRETHPERCLELKGVFEELEPISRVFEGLKVPFSLKMGIAGSGKSTEVLNFLSMNPSFSSMVVSPRRALADDWRRKLKGTVHVVNTFESSLLTVFPAVKMMVFDEISLYPPGFLDLCLIIQILRVNGLLKGSMLFPGKIKKLISEGGFIIPKCYALGDALQNFYYNSTDSVLLDREHDLHLLIKNVQGDLDYLWYSHRLPKLFESFFDIQCLGSEKVEMPRIISEMSVVQGSDYSAMLVASQEDKQNSNFPGFIMTYGESQGLTFEERILIGISGGTLASSENALIVALTRSKKMFDFVLLGGKGPAEILLSLRKKLLGYILMKQKYPEGRLEKLIPFKKVNKVYLNGGLMEKAENDPFIQGEIDINHVFPDEVEEEECLLQPTWMKTHIPISSVNPLLAEVFEKMHLKEHREFWHQSRGYSEQFPDSDRALIEDVMGYSFRFDAIFPRHSGSDDVTFWEGVKKRLTFSNTKAERAKLEESRLRAPEVLDVFLKHLPCRFEVSRNDIEKGLNSFNDKRAEKTEALWKSHMERSDIDWPLNHIFLFMKSQLCTKQEKMFTTAKAGQTLACFHHVVLFRFGPMLRAIERAFIRACGDSYYIHSGKNFSSLNNFVTENCELFQGNSIESDYEAFDSSQDSMILAFEELLLKKIGVSQGFIDDYVTLKLNLGCRLGSLAIMRFTGEFCTFLFNTFANMVFTFIKYEVNPTRDRILFAGDDMASIGALRKREGKEAFLLDLFTLKAKEAVKRIPVFCGWYLTPDGILKSPKLLWARICLQRQKGEISKCLDNYFLEAVFAYNLGERLFDYFEEDEIEYHFVVSRFFVQNSGRFSGLAKQIAYGFGERFGNKDGLPSLGSLWKLMFKNLISLLRLTISSGLNVTISLLPVFLKSVKVIMKFSPVMAIELIRRSFNFLFKIGNRVNKGKASIKPVVHNLSWALIWYGSIASDVSLKKVFLGFAFLVRRFWGLLSKRLQGAFSFDGLSSKPSNLIESGRVLGKGLLVEISKERKIEFVLKPKACLEKILEKKERICQSFALMTLPSELKKKTSKLIASGVLKFMVMSPFSSLKSSEPLGALKAILRLAIVRAASLLSQTSKFSTTLRSSTFASAARSTPTFIWGLLSSASRPWCLTTDVLKGLCAYMMVRQTTWKRASSLLSTLTSRMVPSSLPFGRNICFPPAIPIYQTLSRCFSRSPTSILKRVEKSLALISAAFTGYLTRLGIWSILKVMVAGRSRKFGDAKLSAIMTKSESNLGGTSTSLNSKCQMLTQSLESEDFFNLFAPQGGRGSSLSRRFLSSLQVRGLLSPPQEDLIRIFKERERMSNVQDVIRTTVRQAVDQHLWERYLDPTHVILDANVPVHTAPENRREAVTQILGDYCKSLFGNIAILGSSGKVQWPNLLITLPTTTYRIDGANQTKNLTINLSGVVPALEGFRSSHTDNLIRGCTFRQLCECYASEAFLFLKVQHFQGVNTNIYKKWPRAFDSAPWAAFDFASGLCMHELAPDEKKVLDRLTKRLFRTEGQKGVYEANSEVNVDLEG